MLGHDCSQRQGLWPDLRICMWRLKLLLLTKNVLSNSDTWSSMGGAWSDGSFVQQSGLYLLLSLAGTMRPLDRKFLPLFTLAKAGKTPWPWSLGRGRSGLSRTGRLTGILINPLSWRWCKMHPVFPKGHGLAVVVAGTSAMKSRNLSRPQWRSPIYQYFLPWSALSLLVGRAVVRVTRISDVHHSAIYKYSF